MIAFPRQNASIDLLLDRSEAKSEERGVSVLLIPGVAGHQNRDSSPTSQGLSILTYRSVDSGPGELRRYGFQVAGCTGGAQMNWTGVEFAAPYFK